jgi:hypothetical protein
MSGAGEAETERLRALYGTREAPLRVEPVKLGRKAPPFGREVAAELAAGRPVNCTVFAGPKAWERAKRRRASLGPGSAMVLPAGEDPAMFRWPKLPGVLADARDIDYGAAFALARAIASGGSAPVYVVTSGDSIVVRGPKRRAASEHRD